MQCNISKIQDTEVKGKTVFLRADLDAPMKRKDQKSKIKNEISDDTRLVATLETIEYLLKHGAKIIIAGHLGRPTGFNKHLSLAPIADWLAKRITNNPLRSEASKSQITVKKVGEFDGWQISENITVLENLRFFKEEKANDAAFAQKLACLADIYVNDAFAVCHRTNASIVAITAYLPHYAGIHLQEEIAEMSHILQNPKRPLVVIVGGAKIETKLPLVSKMHKLADYILVGGRIVENEKVLIREQHAKIPGKKSVMLIGELTPDLKDMRQESVENFLQIVGLANTIVWNGPVGEIEKKKTSRGTRLLAEGIVKTSAHTVVGGGNTIGFLKNIGLADKFSFLSTGGGAMLSILAGEKLPGIEALLH